jgi:hypothetical protein
MILAVGAKPYQAIGTRNLLKGLAMKKKPLDIWSKWLLVRRFSANRSTVKPSRIC